MKQLCEGMTLTYEPLTKEERTRRVQKAQKNLAAIPKHPTFYERSAYHLAMGVLSWDATLRQVEAERDALQDELDELRYEAEVTP